MSRFRTPRELGSLIRAARTSRGWTQADLAERARVSRQWLSSVESGQHSRAEFGLILRVLDAVDITLHADLTGTGAPQPAPPSPGASLPGSGTSAAAAVDLDALIDSFALPPPVRPQSS